MKNAQLIYNGLLKFYPHNYRKEFGAQMMQTFIDHYQDVEKSEGRVSINFWRLAITDEVKNITKQQITFLIEENNFQKVSVSTMVVSALLFMPLYALFYVALVKVSLALPHPHVSGIGVIIALAALLLFPGVLSMVVSYMLAHAFVSVFTKHKVKIA
ncbi:MAG: hypothetical protein NT075_31590 [Chloroflexi bacterium]|nr:hypothetical protein [Chloroflexota bacterium]